MKYQILAKDGRAKRAVVETVHGTIQTPVFMNVGTVGAIKGAVSTDDLGGSAPRWSFPTRTTFMCGPEIN